MRDKGDCRAGLFYGVKCGADRHSVSKVFSTKSSLDCRPNCGNDLAGLATQCLQKTVHFCFCHNFVKFPRILRSFGR